MCGERERAGRTQAQDERAKFHQIPPMDQDEHLPWVWAITHHGVNYVKPNSMLQRSSILAGATDDGTWLARKGRRRRTSSANCSGPATAVAWDLSIRARSRRAANRGRRGSSARCGAPRDRPANRRGRHRRPDRRAGSGGRRPASAANSARVRIATPCPAIAALASVGLRPHAAARAFGQFVGRHAGGGEPLLPPGVAGIEDGQAQQVGRFLHAADACRQASGSASA